jgi:hypothetical protein
MNVGSAHAPVCGPPDTCARRNVAWITVPMPLARSVAPYETKARTFADFR